MTNMKPPQEGRNTGAPSLRGLQGRSATGLNRQAAKDEVSAVWRGAGCRKIPSAVPAGRSVFHLTSPLIGRLGCLSRFRAYEIAHMPIYNLVCLNETISNSASL